ncbi:MAG: cytochrome B6 [Acidobacteria bacterium RIFCSPLOWO2_02_FULL_67_36]|nr:MAG: cytochrome B6 [Acidobacteria bacterium RIFCSPLOWO2_02_FULL_67_36]OFW24820.1 MAG: cytochrome B6 [Acidobacteria bacterium RIFCSPLOWO2_12_FULL_66_21]
MSQTIWTRTLTWFDGVRRSVCRVGWPATDKDRAAAMISSLFLHIHPARVSRHVLKPTYTFALGLISAILFVVLSVTGLALMFYYVPYPAEAYRSMKDLQFVVTFGIVLRNIHRWSAHAMVGVVFLHMCRVFWTGSYKRPREFNWVVGVLLLLLTLGLSFTGYLLPWDQLAFWAITVGTNIAAYAPVVGDQVKFLLLGGHVIGATTLLRFYVLHCVMLPLAMLLLISLHVWRVRKDGLSGAENHASPTEELAGVFPASTKTYGLMAISKRPQASVEARDPNDEVFAWPHLLYRELLIALAVIVVLHVVSLVFMAPLEEMADPTRTPNPAKAPWYFLGLQELVSYSALVGGVVVPTLLALALLILPYLDRGTSGSGRWFAPERRIANTIFTAVAAAFVGLIVIGTFFRGPNWAWVWPWK